MADDDDGYAKGWDLLKWKWASEPSVGLVAVVYVVLGLVMLALLATGLWGLAQFLAPIWGSGEAPKPTDGGALRDRLIAIGALVTTPFLVWRLIVAHWAARAAQEQARIAQETSRNTLFTKAVEQLGAMREERVKEETRDAAGAVTGSKETIRLRPNTEVRLGAIYALEKLAREGLDMHWPIMETLCAYVRENAGPARHWSEDEEVAFEEWVRRLKAPTVDVQAAITVIGSRSKAQQDYERKRREGGGGDAWRLDFQGAHLARANLSGMSLAAARFDRCALYLVYTRGVDLREASLVRAHLDGAWLENGRLEGVRLTQAHLDGAWLEGARLAGAWLWRAKLTDAFVAGVDLAGTIGLAQWQLNAAAGDKWTRIPDGLDRPVNERWLPGSADPEAWERWELLHFGRSANLHKAVNEQRLKPDNK